MALSHLPQCIVCGGFPSRGVLASERCICSPAPLAGLASRMAPSLTWLTSSASGSLLLRLDGSSLVAGEPALVVPCRKGSCKGLPAHRALAFISSEVGRDGSGVSLSGLTCEC